MATRTLEAERRFVNAGWWAEDDFLSACLAHGVAPARFADQRLAFIAWYLCECAERGDGPTETECLALAESTGTVDLDTLDRAWFVRLIGEIDEPSSLDALAELVATLAGHREGAARAHLRGLAETCVDLDQFVVTVTKRRSRSFIPPRIAKGSRRGRRIAV